MEVGPMENTGGGRDWVDLTAAWHILSIYCRRGEREIEASMG